MGVIYKISSPSDRLYIGKAKNLRKRVNSHKSASKKDLNILLHNSIRKYGWDAHKLEILEHVENSLLNEREVALIKEYNTYFLDNPLLGMNMTRGGDGNKGSWMHKVELRKWYSERFTGEGNPFYGKTHSEETRKHLAETMSKRNKKNGITVPKWGAEKGQQARRREIVCYDLNGVFAKEYPSLAAASAELNITHSSISDSLSKRKSQAKGYVFRYKTENYPLKIEVEVKQQTVKRAIITVVSGKMWEHPSAQEASEYFLIPKTTINRAAMYNNGKPIRTGHQFYYKDSLKQNRPHIAGRAA
jgi:group I intron endonuclease